ncbi:MAG: hypothetical protein M3430_03875 [Acidobacteriota bacterium]|nr:hypothetical protein [Acidobacteriota bacterium]
MAILMLATFPQISVSAQDIISEEKSDEQTQEDLSARRANTRRLEGVWNLTVTVRNCQTGAAIRTFPAMHTYMRGGTMSDFGVGSAPLPRSSGQGVWSYQSRDHYSAAFQFFRFNADGTYAGRQINRVQIELSRFDDSYTSSATAQTFDVNGNVIANSCFTATATRFE